MLTINSATVKEFFVFKNDNKNYPAEYTKWHVPGIFFQNKLTRMTYFCNKRECIHGIQMLPLTPALQLVRSGSFCYEEYVDQLSDITMEVLKDRPPFGDLRKWMSILVSGNVALHDPTKAWDLLMNNVTREFIDDGLTRSWAMYWTSTQTQTGPWPTPAPTPVPPPPCQSGTACDPNSEPPQVCPPGEGGMQCPSSGFCGCPDPTPAPDLAMMAEKRLLQAPEPVSDGVCPTPAPTQAPTPAPTPPPPATCAPAPPCTCPTAGPTPAPPAASESAARSALLVGQATALTMALGVMRISA